MSKKKWVQAAADEVSQNEPTVAFKLEHEALAKTREDRRSGCQKRRQERLLVDQQADPGQARVGSRAECGKSAQSGRNGR